jgi:hypothetical protein
MVIDVALFWCAVRGNRGYPYWEQPCPSLERDRCLKRQRPPLFNCALCDALGRRSGRRIPISRIVAIVDGRLIVSSCRTHAPIADEISIAISRV